MSTHISIMPHGLEDGTLKLRGALYMPNNSHSFRLSFTSGDPHSDESVSVADVTIFGLDPITAQLLSRVAEMTIQERAIALACLPLVGEEAS